ncbi:MAG TPA: electron transfer flavoprotein subunit beta/FixA family protein [Desulfobacteraceae bacterium]|nr:electron transfer flavoprotein subunit beta/FixA family protein [Desulfobacteraceae bacterium]|tara:strand:+ start:940 stop:1710 length:771 start_codon:yes stop_codon:yes gene_type:complete
MQIYVCVKHVPDSAANIHILGKDQIDENVAFLLNPYDEHAVSEAASLKKANAGSEIIAVTVGKADADKTLRSAMAMGADRGLLVETDAACDSMTTARALVAAIKRDGTPDIILTGKESIDAEGMQTLFRVGAMMDMPVVTNAAGLTVDGANATVVCELSGGNTRTFETNLPCVIGAGRGLNTPAYPTFPDVVKARKKPVETISLDSLGIDAPKGSAKIVGLAPLVQNRTPKEITGTPAEQAAQIVNILKNEAKVIS